MLTGSDLELLIGSEFKDCFHGYGLEGGWHIQKNSTKLTCTQHMACMHVYIYTQAHSGLQMWYFWIGKNRCTCIQFF